MKSKPPLVIRPLPPNHSTAVQVFDKICPACETQWESLKEQKGNPRSTQTLTLIPRDLSGLTAPCWVSWNLPCPSSNVWIFVTLGTKRKVDMCLPLNRARERFWFRNSSLMRHGSTIEVCPSVVLTRICHCSFSGKNLVTWMNDDGFFKHE